MIVPESTLRSDSLPCGGTMTRAADYDAWSNILLKPHSSRIQATVEYEYDDLYQLTSEQRTGTLAYDKNYTYDKVGNRLTMVVGETTTYYHYDSANKLDDYGPSDTPPYTGNTFLDYDDAGNLLTKTPPAGSPTSYTYNWQNRMTEIEVGTETIAQFAYDGEGVRCSGTFDSGTTLFRYDKGNLIAELDGQGALEAFYQLGPGGASSRQTASMAYYHADGLGSVKAISSAQSAVTDSYTYDAWGNELAHFGSSQQPYEFVGALGYYTHYQEPSVSLLQLGVRFYDPEVGRFTQRDGWGETSNRYLYVRNAPTSFVDPDGRSRRNINPDERDADIDEAGFLGTVCAYVVRLRAIRDVQGQFIGQNLWDDSRRNAVLHCYWTALIALCCGRDVAVTVTNNHEKYNWDPRTGSMDMGNNKNGLTCFDQMKPCKNPGLTTPPNDRTELMRCCKRAKPVYPPDRPVPEYPGGNK